MEANNKKSKWCLTDWPGGESRHCSRNSKTSWKTTGGGRGESPKKKRHSSHLECSLTDSRVLGERPEAENRAKAPSFSVRVTKTPNNFKLSSETSWLYSIPCLLVSKATPFGLVKLREKKPFVEVPNGKSHCQV
jgi:hypothetical protein